MKLRVWSKGTPAGMRGVTMIENLVALVVTMFGLFALLGFNMRAFNVESESYQRSQALILVQDMAQRIKANRANVASYAVAAASAAGAGAVETCNSGGARAATDLCEWGNLLRGAAETTSGGSRVGAMADGRGCIVVTPPASGASGPTSVNVVVVWRGTNASRTNSAAPCVPEGYSVSDGYMRYTSSIVSFGVLNGG